MPNTSGPGSLPPGEARYRRKQAHRGRGLADLHERVGDVCAEIDARLRRQETVRVLELGCGYAIALLDVVARYGARVETYGLNLRREEGQDEILRREAKARNVDTDGGAGLPSLLHGDVAHGVPLADATVDVVVSQVAWRYFRNKIGVLRDVVRVLRPDGVGMIDADEFDAKLPPEYGRLVEIWGEGALVAFEDYAARFGMTFVPTPRGRALRLVKNPSFGEDLVPSMEIDANAIDARWDGIKCIYALQGR
ncbi:MAG TPA: methyltransferase domain-containing protein [Casimicrobiaceae bacterium]|nr:methyltransferase domain-containing protein [Casimicrobiaceae bacterium]